MPEVLTLPEAARHLRLSERALYDLARTRGVPAVRLGGRWLFPKATLDGWLAARATEGTATAPPPVLAGSHDPLLEWALRHAATGLAFRPGGSLDGLDALAAGSALAAACHLPDPDTGGFNEAAARAVMAGRPVVGVTWAVREQGLIVPGGNPRGLTGIPDLARPGLMVAGRGPRAGSHVLLLHLLAEAGLRLDRLRLTEPPAASEEDVADAVRSGAAAVGFGVRAAAGPGLGFVPVVRERFDLVMAPAAYFVPAIRALLGFARTPALAARAAALGGYDLSDLGAVAFGP